MYENLATTKVSDILKAIDEDREQKQEKQQQAREPVSTFIDPFNISNFVGPTAKPGPVSYAILRHMAGVPAVAAVLNTRLNQMANFTHVAKNDKDTGFKITLREEDAKPDGTEKKEIYNLEQFFLRTGFAKNRKRTDNFNQFMRKLTRDSLTLDEVAIEAVEGMNARKNPIAELYAIDAATVEIVIPSSEKYNYVYEPVTERGQKMHPEDIAYVQRVNGVVQAEYSEDMLIRSHRNPRTDIEYAFFGYSELEQLVSIVTAIVNGFHYNASYFTQSNLPQGVLEIVGKYQPEHLEAFKRAWTTLVSGSVGRQWKVPVMALEEGQGFKFTPFKNSNRDMEYSNFMEFLFNLACAVYQIDPREVGFKSWDSSGSGKQSDNDAPATTMENSKDKGFRPLMQFFADLFNDDILDVIAPKYKFEWVGLDEDRSKAEWAMEKEQLEAGVLTLEMYWARHDIDNQYQGAEWTQLPANQVLAGYITGQQQGEQQQQLQDGQHQNALEAQLHTGIQGAAMERMKGKQAADLADQQHANTLEQGLHQGVQQSGLEAQKGKQAMAQADQQAGHTQAQAQQAHGHALKQKFADAAHAKGIEGVKAKNALQQQDAAHANTMEATMAQGVQQSGLEAQKGKQAMQQQDAAHANTMEAAMAQGVQQSGLERQKLGGQKELAQQGHNNTLKQNFAQAQHTKGVEGVKQKGAQQLAGQQHEQALEQQLMQAVQALAQLRTQQGGQKDLQQGQQQHDATMADNAALNQQGMERMKHQLVLRQKMADSGHSRGQMAQQHKYTMEREKAKGKKDLSKSLDADIITIEIVLV